MGMTLGDELRQQESDLVRKNAARRIHEAIKQAKAKKISEKRWPWELVQNACDSARNAGDDPFVTIRVDLHDDTLCFQHTGGLFTPEDLSLLILAGSLKELRPVRYGGRFGSGFIVTHILSETVTIEGKAERGDGAIQDFQFVLDRSGTPDDILGSIERAYEQLAIPRADRSKARYIYPLRDPRAKQVARIGLATFRELTPYVLAFVPYLNSVEVSMDGVVSSWERGEETEDDGVSLLRVKVTELSAELCERSVIMIRIGTENSGPWCAVAAERANDGSLTLKSPTKAVPKLFYPYPLLGSTEQLGLPVVIGGDFYPTEERDDILLAGSTEDAERNKAQLIQAFKAIPVLAGHASVRGWQGAHLLARVSAMEPESGVAEPEWWNGELKSIVQELLKRKIVLTQRGRVSTPLDEEISFPLPLLEYDLHHDDTRASDITLERIWRVAAHVAELPALEIANDWQLTVREWNKLRRLNSVDLTDLMRLAEEVRDRKNLAVLADDLFSGDQGAAAQWLNTFFSLLREYEASTGRGLPPDFLEALVPNQKGVPKTPGELRRDADIPELLKDIAEEFGWLVRETLLHNQFSSQWLDAKVQGKLDKDEVVERLVSGRMNWKEGGIVEQKRAQPAVKLAAWMALDKENWAKRAVQMPVFSNDYMVRRIAGRPTLLPPISQWKESDLPFRPVFEFEKPRFLAESYVQGRSTADAKAIVGKLADWGALYPDLVWLVAEVELGAKELESILKERPEKPMRGQHTLRSLEPGRAISVIPLLVSELVGALGQDPERARLFMKFLLEVVITKHKDWQRPVAVSCSCGAKHEVYPAEWLAHLRTKYWVPYRASDEAEYEPAGASAETLRQLLGSSLQEFSARSDGIQLLTFLGFDSLELQIVRLTVGDEGKREELASVLTEVGKLEVLQQLVQAVRTQERLEDLLALVEKRADTRRIVERNQSFGRTVQEVVEAVFRAQGFDVLSGYKGYDFEAYYRGDVEPADLGRIELQVAGKRYLVEVKATRGYKVRMTPTQAETAVAQAASYVLCVVDLGSKDMDDFVSQDHLYRAVQDSISIVDTIGTELRSVIDVDLPTSENVEVELIGQIRYVVKPKLWKEGGYTLQRWVAERVRT